MTDSATLDSRSAQPDHPAGGRPVAEVGAVLAVWALAAAGPVARLWVSGPNQRALGVLLAVLLLIWVAALAIRPWITSRWWYLAVVTLVACGVSVATLGVGRAPALVGLAGAAVAHRSIRSGDDGRAPIVDISPGGCIGVALTGIVWFTTGRNASAAVVLVVSLVAATTPAVVRWRPERSQLVARSIGRGLVTRHWPVIPVALIFAVLPAPVWWALATGSSRFAGQINDFENHIAVSRQLQVWPPRSYSPHFLFPALIRLTSVVVDDTVGAVLVIALSNAALAVAIYYIARRSWNGGATLGRRGALTFALITLLADNPSLLVRAGTAWWERSPLDPDGTGGGLFIWHFWASPTSALATPFALLLFVVVLDILTDAPKPLLSRSWSIAALTVAATLAKPPMTLVLLVGAPLFALVDRLDAPRRRLLVAGFVVPGALVVAFQTVFLATGVNPDEQTTWTISPLWLVFSAHLYRPVIWTGALLIGIAWWAGGRRYLRDPAIRLALISTGVAVIPTFVLRETGDKANHGNLAWTTVFSLLMLLVFSLRFLAVEWTEWRRRRGPTTRGPAQRPPAWIAATGAWLALAITAGIVHLLVLGGAITY